MKYLTVIFLLFINFLSALFAQNLVPNPGFESVKKLSGTWIRSNIEFSAQMKEWTCPNVGSPDVLFNKMINNIHPPRKGVDLSGHKPHSGDIMVGIKSYGCFENAKHCREYLQVKLKKPIENGEKYFVEFWVNAMKTSLLSNNLGIAFSDVEIIDPDDNGIYYLDPTIVEKRIIKGVPNKWHRVSATIVAKGYYEYLLIGNFLPDDLTDIEKSGSSIPYSYYLIDDVQVRHLSENEEFDITQLDFSPGNTISLNNILFKTSKADLLPESFTELNNLYKILDENPGMVIKLNGHTDNIGSDKDNQNLSNNRAFAVVEYLIKKGIDLKRLKYQGYGESQPITSNDEPEGRKLNRRVEFVILEN